MTQGPDGDILVAIPTLNEAGRIRSVLDQLRIDLPQDRATRIVVLDGGSTDGTQALVDQIARTDARISLVANPARTQSTALNLASRLTEPRERYLLRADAHTDFPPAFVASVVSVLGRDDVDAVVVPMDSCGQTCFARSVAWVSDTIIGSGGSAHRGGRSSGFVDHGHHAGWKLACFRAVGGYDESFSHNEDAELDCRINRMGMRIWLAADIRLDYHVRQNPWALFRQYRNYGRGRSRTVRRHPGSARLRQWAVPSAVFSLALAGLAGFAVWPIALLWPATYLAALTITSLWLALRHGSPCGLLAGPAAAAMHVGWATGFLEGVVTNRVDAWQIPVDADAAPAPRSTVTCE